jgi:hypothetical protein
VLFTTLYIRGSVPVALLCAKGAAAEPIAANPVVGMYPDVVNRAAAAVNDIVDVLHLKAFNAAVSTYAFVAASKSTVGVAKFVIFAFDNEISPVQLKAFRVNTPVGCI